MQRHSPVGVKERGRTHTENTVAVVLSEPLPAVRDMRTHGGEPFFCIEDLPIGSIFGRIYDGFLVGGIPRPIL